jgi:signal recognition particle subunit SRP54
MFERLSDNLNKVIRNLTGRGRLTESNISDAMQEVRRALLDADVNYHVAKEFVQRVRQKCVGTEVLKSVTPGQQVVKVVHDELLALFGGETAALDLAKRPAAIMMVGLHGGGKTTSAAKLANLLKTRHDKKVLLAACDLQRPAAITQLQTLGESLGIEVYAEPDNKNVTQVAYNARTRAIQMNADVLIVDTAGRLQIDAVLVQELVEVRKMLEPAEILLVADAALGQEAVSVAKHFHEALQITGIVLTKLDGDARGGAALSMRQVTGCPIKFIGLGEQPKDFDVFHPDRMAGRILGMGDVVTLVENASRAVSKEEADKLNEKLRKNTFTLDDFRDQIQKVRKMGGLVSMLKMLPGMGDIAKMIPEDDNVFRRMEGMICAMTVKERNNPDIITPSRARRIAKGSAHKPEEVNQLVKQFQMMRKMVGQMGKQGMFDMPKGGMPPGMDMGMLGGNPFGGGMPGMGNPFGAPPPRGHGGPGSFMPKGKMRRR